MSRKWSSGVIKQWNGERWQNQSPLLQYSIPALDLATKTALPNRLKPRAQERALDPKDIKEIKAFIDLMKKNDLSVFEIEKDGFRPTLQKSATDQTTVAAPLAVISPSKSAAATSEAANAVAKPAASSPLKETDSPR